jgi:hypothetical protein
LDDQSPSEALAKDVAVIDAFFEPLAEHASMLRLHFFAPVGRLS